MSYGLLCFCVGALLAAASAYPSQVAETACRDMTPKGPGHENAGSQKSPIPKEFTFEVDSATIRKGNSVGITILAANPKSIAGLMVQARAPNSDTPLGEFTPKSANVRTVSCSAENDTASHNDPSPKKKILLSWKAPVNYKGKVEFYWTPAPNKTTFWAKRKAATVTIV